jgi:proteasome lid subunit RPN8/RPN11
VIVVPKGLLKSICYLAEAAYPRECCGLLIGRDNSPTAITVTRIAESENVANGPGLDRFEVDPQVRFDIMRQLGCIGASGSATVAPPAERVVGHFHSHPDHPAQPSQTDLEMAFEPEMIWVITAVVDGRATQTTAHRLDPLTRQFRELYLTTTET